MAFLYPAVTEGIALSNDLSNRRYSDIYDPAGLFRIDEVKLAKVVKAHLVATGSKINAITVSSFDGFENNVCGMVHIKGNIAEIVVNNKLNDCWRRFTICKELLQLYCDNNETAYTKYSQQEIIEQLDKLKEAQDKFFTIPLESGISGLKKAFVEDKSFDEFLAITMAIVLIFPPKQYGLIRAIFKGVDKGDITYFDVALTLKMPEYFIIKYHQIFFRSIAGE